MNEQNTKDAEYLRALAMGVPGEGAKILLRIAYGLDPKPEHPSSGEIVEVTVDGGTHWVGYAYVKGIYPDKEEPGICEVLWNRVKSWRILPDPDKCIVIEKKTILRSMPEMANKVILQGMFLVDDLVVSEKRPHFKTITREELEAK